jgi:hypothetical protein
MGELIGCTTVQLADEVPSQILEEENAPRSTVDPEGQAN